MEGYILPLKVSHCTVGCWERYMYLYFLEEYTDNILAPHWYFMPIGLGGFHAQAPDARISDDPDLGPDLGSQVLHYAPHMWQISKVGGWDFCGDKVLQSSNFSTLKSCPTSIENNVQKLIRKSGLKNQCVKTMWYKKQHVSNSWETTIVYS